MPNELRMSIDRIKEIVEALKYKVFEIEGYEADDIIASIVRKSSEKFEKVYIVSSDKDLLQLIDKSVNVLVYDNQGYTIYDRNKVFERFSVFPEFIPDYFVLVGDSADNIEGVKGIGKKTASEIINKYGKLENILNHIDELPAKIGLKLHSIKEEIIKRRDQLFKLKTIDIEIDEEELSIKQPDKNKLFSIFRELEFYKFMEEFSETAPIIEIKEEEFEIFDGDIVEILNGYIYKLNGSVVLKRKIRKEDFEKNISVFESKEQFKHGAKHIVFDLTLADYLIDPEFASHKSNENTVEYILLKYFGQKPSQNEEQQIAYKLKSVYLLKEQIEEKLRTLDMLNLLKEIEIPVSKVISNMEKVGIKIDVNYLSALSLEFQENLRNIEREIYQLAGKKFNINSPKQLQEVLFKRLGLKPIKKTKTGYSTDTETLIKLSEIHPIAKKILEYREVFKLKSAYIDSILPMANPQTHRIHPIYNQRGTSTGRISASNPNIQTIPIKSELGKKIRKAFISDKSKLFIKADYSQIELRILAHLSEDEKLIYAFLNDYDIHTITSRIIFSKDEISEEERRIGKTVNFAIIYGVSPYGLSKQINTDQEIAEKFIDTYFKHYEGVKNWIEYIKNFAKENGYVKTILNRRRIIPKLAINSQNKVIRESWERICINSPVQGSASDIIKLAMIKTEKFNPILQVHDELVFEVDENKANEYANTIKEIMENVIKLKVPLKVNIEISNSL